LAHKSDYVLLNKYYFKRRL